MNWTDTLRSSAKVISDDIPFDNIEARKGDYVDGGAKAFISKTSKI
jgi:hypothetical protein